VRLAHNYEAAFAAQLQALGGSSPTIIFGSSHAMARRRVRDAVLLVASGCGIVALVLASPWMYAWGAGRLWDRAEREVHLLPVGYTGPVVILLAEPNAAQRREGGARLFQIPASGVAHSGFPINDGLGRPDYFYVDARGRRTRIVAGTPCQRELVGDPVQACLLGHTTLFDAKGHSQDRPYEAYVVGRRADQAAWSHRSDRFVDSVVYGRVHL
jgi:hypothetical protein